MPDAPAGTESTPLMRQYGAIKRQHPEALLFFRLGDFYELFFADAVLAARELGITLTARNKEKGQAVPMCGVPYHSAEGYIARLIRKGHKVAICDQVEDPKMAKQLVRRAVTRVVTPGTAALGLAEEENSFLAAVARAGRAVGFAALDLSTGDFRATEFAGDDAERRIADELAQLAPREVLFASSLPLLDVYGGDGHRGDLTGDSGGAQNSASPLGATAALAGAGCALTPLEDWVFAPDYALPLVENHFGVLSLEGYGLAGRAAAATAAGAILHYVRATQRGQLEHVDRIGYYERQSCLVLDAVTVRNLELVESMAGAGSACNDRATLFRSLDATLTAMGKRLLRSWLLRPALDVAEINARLEAVAAGVRETLARDALRRALAGIQDLERLLSRVTLESATARDLLALAASLCRIPALRSALVGIAVHGGRHGGTEAGQEEEEEEKREKEETGATGQEAADPQHHDQQPPSLRASTGNASRLAELAERLQAGAAALDALRARIEQTLVPEPPLSLAEGGVIADGVDAGLDELRHLSRNSKQLVAAIEQRERARTGISSLKVKFTSVFGYYLEVTRPNLHLVPPGYERKQTLVNAERFTTAELKEHESRILDAQEKMVEIERRLFHQLRAAIAGEAKPLRQTALALAEVDVLAGFAHVAAERGWTRPEFVNEEQEPSPRIGADARGSEQRLEVADAATEIDLIRENPRASAANEVLEITAGRHPVVEQQELSDRFVPNDLYLDGRGHAILLVTGPNMGGKSTYLRQTALIVILAQMGSFVPAAAARLTPVDRIFTRIGAADNLARGRSTFMVEMTETATILNTATGRSLILLDEIGRGTATYDGLALAWATIEYIHGGARARTLFATHYHELTELAERLPGVKNVRVAVKETAGGIVFLRKVEPGAADRSYGIEVAKLAGMPPEVIARARQVLAEHESAQQAVTEHLEDVAGAQRTPESRVQLTIFTPLSQKIVETLRQADVNALTPLEALNLLAELKKQIE